VIVIFLLFIIYFINFISIIVNIGNPLLIIPGFSIIGLLSILIYIFILLIVVIRPALYFLFLPFIILAFPSVINNFFPSYYLGPIDERGASAFSFITHIDIYLMYGLIVFKQDKTNKLKLYGTSYKYNILGVLIVSILFIYTIITTLGSKTGDALALFAIGNYQIRYILYLTLFYYKFNIDLKKLNYIIYGLCLSVVFLFIESLIFTFVNGHSRLSSGSLGNNVYANIIAAIGFLFSLLLIYYKKIYSFMKVKKTVLFISFTICMIIVFLTGTRISLLSLTIASILLFILSTLKDRKINYKYIVGLCSMMLIITVFVFNSERYRSILDIVSKGDIAQQIVSANPEEQYDKFTSSLYSRYIMAIVSLDMFKDNISFGIGIGRWNKMKYDYGWENRVLLDPHNDFLSYISQYGILGILLLFIVYIFPILKFINIRYNPYCIFGAIPFVLFFSSFTNSNTLKHQIFAITILCIVIICNHTNYIEEND